MADAVAPSAVASAAGGAVPRPTPELADLLDHLATPDALSELAALAACLGLAWLIVKALRRRLQVDGAVLFGRRLVDGVLFPVVALLLALLVRQALRGWVVGAVFKVAVPVLLSLALIRLTARVLAAALPGRGWARFVEHTVSWLAWIAVVLWISGVLPVVLDQMDALTWKIGGARVSLRSLAEGALTAGVVMVLALWLSAAIEKKLIRGTGDNLSLRMMGANLVRIALLAAGLLVALSAVGIDLTALSVLGGAVGVGVGFGMQKIAANYVSGFVILAERSLRIGDTVKVDGFEGRVTNIRTRYTAIRSLDGHMSIVPNELLITQRVENSSLADPRIALTTPLQVAYGTDLDALLPRLAAAMAAVPRVLAEPAPNVHLAGFGADGLNLALGFWIDDPHAGLANVKSNVNLAVLRCLNAEGIEIPFPQRVLHHGHVLVDTPAPADSSTIAPLLQPADGPPLP